MDKWHHFHIVMGEGAAQAASIVVQAAYTRNIFDGGKPASIEDFQAELPGVSYEHYAHITSVVRPVLPVLASNGKSG